MRQPGGFTFKKATKGAYITYQIKWPRDFAKAADHKIQETQKFIDTETFRHCMPYMPMGIDRGSGGFIKQSQDISNQLVGTGEIAFAGPSARMLYYGLLMIDPDTGSPFAKKGTKKVLKKPKQKLNFHGAPMRGSYWVERMWGDKKYMITESVQKYFDNVR